MWVQHHNGIFVSSDEGRTFTEVSDVEPSVFGFAVAVHPREPDTAWFVPEIKDEKRIPLDGQARGHPHARRRQELRRSCPRACRSRTPTMSSTAMRSRSTRPASALAFGSTTGGLWVSEDQGDSWTCVTHTLPPIYAVRFG